MSRLEEIRERLNQTPGIIWWEEEQHLPYLRRAGFYQQVSFQDEGNSERWSAEKV